MIGIFRLYHPAKTTLTIITKVHINSKKKKYDNNIIIVTTSNEAGSRGVNGLEQVLRGVADAARDV